MPIETQQFYTIECFIKISNLREQKTNGENVWNKLKFVLVMQMHFYFLKILIFKPTMKDYPLVFIKFAAFSKGIF